MQYRLRTLLILLAIGPPMLAAMFVIPRLLARHYAKQSPRAELFELGRIQPQSPQRERIEHCGVALLSQGIAP
jgi:hypothetical protein